MIVTLIAGLALMVGAAPGRVTPPRDDLDGEDMQQALRLLRGSYPDARARGVRKLAAIGTREAWARVRKALEDRDAQVADAAQRAMAGTRDARLLSAWLGRDGLRDRDPWVRLRVAQVAGVVELPVEGSENFIELACAVHMNKFNNFTRGKIWGKQGKSNKIPANSSVQGVHDWVKKWRGNNY